jgi:hypothetical protein
MRTLPALACDVEEMFHTHKVTGKECKYPCVRPRLETKTLLLPSGFAAYILVATSISYRLRFL